ncbi:MAG: nicotinate-nucleotide adenylyltransferase [Hyphomicrobiales bacterium]|nr:nicotinate-nucleotide adenylyltransferase [Hyphomicrobiales bacterium]MCP4997439.1 nicotinate-nucleotide adenylyltransferase [Hyphomicrobiales bacterium]
MPHVEAGMTVGLFGGSFNPPHQGHVLVVDTVLRKLGLDQLWWIVTPGNPLKEHDDLAELSQRIRWSQDIVADPRVKITAFEAARNLHYTAETLRYVTSRNRNVNFVWVMGADNLAGFHHWQDWQFIANAVPIAIVDRPGSTLSYLSSIMAKTFGHARVDESDAAALAHMQPPAWTFIHGPRSPLSSTAIRDTGE